MRVGARSARPSGVPGAQGHGSAYESPARATTLRTSEKPFECRPEEGRPSRTSPGAMVGCGRILSRSTAPTANPARS